MRIDKILIIIFVLVCIIVVLGARQQKSYVPEDTARSEFGFELSQLERQRIALEAKKLELSQAKISDKIGAVPMWRQIKYISLGSLVAIICIGGLSFGHAYRELLLTHTIKIGKHSIPIKDRDLRRTDPSILEGLVLAEQLKAQAPEKALQLYMELAKVNVSQIRALAGHVPKAIQPGETQALPQARFDVPTMSQLLQKNELAPGQPLIYGFEKGTGEPQTGTVHGLYSTISIGLSGFGKTTFFSYLIGSSILAEKAEACVFDLHYPAKESLGKALGELIDSQYITLISNPFEADECITQVEALLDKRLSVESESYIPFLLVVDEHETWIRNKANLLALEMRIINEGRKVAMYLFLTSKSAKADKIGDSALRDGMLTSFVFKTKTHNARTFYKDKDRAKLVEQLSGVGEAVFCDSRDTCHILALPYASRDDMHMIAARLPEKESELIDIECISDSTAKEKLKEACEKESGEEIAEKLGVSPAYISQMRTGKRPITPGILQKIKETL